MRSLTSRFAREASGATAIEYGLIAGCIALSIVTALTQFGVSMTASFAVLIAVFNR